MREVDRALKLDPTNTELLAQKAEILAKQAETAKEKLSTLKDVQAQVEQQFKNGDIGEEAYRAFQREIAVAQANVSKLEQELEDTGDTMDDTAKDAEELSDSIEDAGKSADDSGEKLNKLADIAKKVGAAAAASLAAIGTAAVGAAKKLWDMSNDVASAGDNIDKTSQKIGISAESYQEWSYVFERCGADVNQLQGGMKSLRTAMDNVRDATTGGTVDYDKLSKAQTKCKNAALDLKSAQISYNAAVKKSGADSAAAQKAYISLQKAQNKLTEAEESYSIAQKGTAPNLSEAGKALKELGVETTTVSGEWRSEEEVFAETITALQQMTNETERARIASIIFGKSGTELAALLNTTAEETQSLKDEAHDYGMIMSDEAVAASAAFEDSLTRLKHTVTGFKNNIIGEFLPGISLIMDAFSDLIAGNEEAGAKLEEGLKSVLDNITSLVPKFVEMIKGIASAVLQCAPEILTALAQGIIDALPELVPVIADVIGQIAEALAELLPELADAVIQIILKVIDAITNVLPTLLPKLTAALTQILQAIVDNLPLLLKAGLELIKGLVKGILKALPTLIDALPALITGIVDFILSSIPEIIQAGIDLLTALVEDLPTIIQHIVKVLPQIISGIIESLLRNLPQIIQAGIDLLTALIHDLPTIIATIVKAIPDIITGIIDALINNIPLLIETGIKLFISIVENLPEIIFGIVESIPEIIAAIVEALIKGIPQLAGAGVKIFGSLFENMPDIFKNIGENVAEIVAKIVKFFKELPGKLYEIGKNMIEGLINGIKSMTENVGNTLKQFGEGCLNQIKKGLRISSPSKVFRDEVGRYMALGIGVGFTDNMESVAKDMENSIPRSFDVSPDINMTNINKKASQLSESAAEASQQIVFCLNVENFNNRTDRDLEEIMDYAGRYFSAQMQRRSVVF